MVKTQNIIANMGVTFTNAVSMVIPTVLVPSMVSL